MYKITSSKYNGNEYEPHDVVELMMDIFTKEGDAVWFDPIQYRKQLEKSLIEDSVDSITLTIGGENYIINKVKEKKKLTDKERIAILEKEVKELKNFVYSKLK